MSSKKKKKPDYTAYEDREALCPHFEKCGGCTMQKVTYEKQLQIKADEVKQLLGIRDVDTSREEHTLTEDSCECGFKEDAPAIFEGISGSPFPEGYRNKMEFTFGDEHKDGPFALGLHMKGSFMNIVNITDCRLVHQDLNIIRNAARDFFEPFYERGEISFRNNKTGKGYLRHLLLRRSWKNGEILCALVTTTQFPGISHHEKTAENELMKEFSDTLTSLTLEGKITGILHILNDAASDVVKSDRTDILFGRDFITEEILGLTFKISPFSFFQTNSSGAEILYSKVREYARLGKGTLFDLYSGTGTIAQLMSPEVDQVIGVEIVPEAVEAARENAERNGIGNVQFIASDVLKVLDELPRPDYIILDPPREGINPKALGKILGYGVENIIYVSCKPSSLAKELQSFRLAGYEMIRVCCVDMFPQTGHVECVCLLSNRKPDSYVHLNLKMEDYYRIKDAQKEQGKK